MTDPVTPTATSPDKPKRARKGKPKPPAAPKVERAKRTTPARTLRRRVEDLGTYHLEAFDRARRKGGEEYERSVRDALDAVEHLDRASARKDQLRAQLDQAIIDHERTSKIAADARLVLDRLTLAAKTLAGLDHPDVEAGAPTDEDRKGVEIP